MNVLVCGSREWDDPDAVGGRIRALPGDTLVIHGGARGADSHAARYALERGLFVASVPVHMTHWRRYGKRAGLKRTDAMLDLGPELVIAYSLGTPGTSYTIEQARARGIEVEVHDGR